MTQRNIVTAMLIIIVGTIFTTAGQEAPPEEQPESTTQPATTQPAEQRSTLRRPAQADIIRNLLRDREQTGLILPRNPDSTTSPGVTEIQPAEDGDRATLLADGTGLVERPGRLIWEKGKPVFVFIMQEGGSRLQSMELLPNQLLEALEQEAERGISEFVISARVTRYKGENYLLLRKVLHHVNHGNISP